MYARRAHLDFETRSAAQLVGARGVGVHKYAEHPSTGIWGFSYGFGDGLLFRWRPGQPDPHDLLQHIAMGGMVVAHNAEFERTIWAMMRARYNLGHWPVLRTEQLDCTASRARYMNLPPSLANLGAVLGLRTQKDLEGAALMRKMSTPIGRDKYASSWGWHDSEADRSRLEQYQDTDVRTETEADSLLLPLTPFEREVWELDQLINDRGIPFDVAAVTRAVDLTAYAKKMADKRMAALTDGAVKKCSEVERIADWLNARGFKTETFRKDDHEDLLVLSDIGGDNVVREVIELRRDAGKSSVSKFARILDCVCADDRARGQYIYCGATQTHRFSGTHIQVQNLRRFDLKRDGVGVRFTISMLHSNFSISEVYEILRIAFEAASGTKSGGVLEALSKCTRGLIKAEEGQRFIGGDYSNVEGRLNAWLAGEQWKLDAFRAYDKGTGPDLYNLSYSKSFGKPVDQIYPEERQLGKVTELSLGYQGAVAAFLKMCKTYLVKPASVVEPVRRATPADVWFQVRELYHSAPDKHGLFQDEWTAVKIIVRGWRDAHPKIKQSWWDLQDAAIQAVSEPNSVVYCYDGRVAYLFDGNNLYCQLPDRTTVLYYNNAFLRYEETEYVEVAGTWINVDEFWPFEIEEFKRLNFRFKKRGRNVVYFHYEVNRQWTYGALYGGLQCENIVQATGRAIFVRAMLRVEKAGYPIIMHTHDDILAQVPIASTHSVAEFKQLMHIDEPWLQGLPLAVSCFEGERFIK